MKSERQLNVILRESIKRISIEYLEGCEEFVQVFGKGFVARQFEENVIDVYSNEKNEECSGYYALEDRSITICSSGKNDKLLTPMEVEHDEDIKGTSVHETIHGILVRGVKSRNKAEIAIDNIRKILGIKQIGYKIGTGILEQRPDGSEIAIGLNEGLTEWICKIAGLKANSYKNLVKIIELLEVAIGTTNVMRLGKGNVEKNVTRILGMSKRECEFFLRLGDQECTLGRNSSFFARVINRLGKEINPENLRKLKEDSRIKTFLESEEFKLAIQERGQDKEGEIILEYAREQLEDIGYARRTNLLMIHSTIFDKYFKKEFEQIQDSQEISYEQIQRFEEIVELMEQDTGDKNEERYSSIKFQREFKQMLERYLTEFYQGAVREYQEGRLSSSRIKEYYSKAMGIDVKVRDGLMKVLASEMNPEHPEAISWLISDLCANGEIDDIYRYSIQKVKTEEAERTIYLKDGEMVATMYSPIEKKLEKASNKREQFEFTLTMDEEFEDIISNFSKLKEETEKADPNAIIQISDRIIRIRGVNGVKLYMIEKGQIVPAENVQEIEFEIAEERSKAELAIRKPIDRIRAYLFNRRQEASGKRLETRMQRSEFKSRVRNMSNYTMEPVARNKNCNSRIEKKHIENEEIR